MLFKSILIRVEINTCYLFCRSGHPKTLDQFNYTDSDITDIMFKCIGNQSIVGLTHNISFKNGNDPVMNGQMERIQGIMYYSLSRYRYAQTKKNMLLRFNRNVYSNDNLSKFSNSKNTIFEGLIVDRICQISSLVKYRRNKQTKNQAKMN